MPKATKHATLNKIKDAIVGGKEQQEPIKKTVFNPTTYPSTTTPVKFPSVTTDKKKRKYTKTSSRWTTQKDLNDVILKDIASNCCGNNKDNTDLLDIPVQTQKVQQVPITPTDAAAAAAVIKPSQQEGGEKKIKRMYTKKQQALIDVADPSSKFHKINAWKSPWEKLYVMITLRDLDRMRLSFIQKKLKKINSAEVFRDALKVYYEIIRKQEKEKKTIIKK